jgi:hypothetical protein
LSVTSALGRHTIVVHAPAGASGSVRVTTTFTPASPMLMPFAPRDLYPLDERDDPLGAVGRVEAKQRGLNAGVVYLHLDEPDFGDVLYFHNLTASNDYYRATGTTPNRAVGGT